MKCVSDLSADFLKGKRVLVRAGFDVPVEQGSVLDTFRLKRGLETVFFLQKAGAKTILISHIGRKGESLEPVARALKTMMQLTFVPEVFGRHVDDALNAMTNGDVLLLENLRQDAREEENNELFAKKLALYADVFVNDAFSNAHRPHASMVSIPKFLPSYGGIELCEEIAQLTQARSPLSPSLAIIGGAKFETKEPLIVMLLERYDRVFVTGALMNDFYKARGLEVGRSLISEGVPSEEMLSHPHLMLPVDVTVELLNGQARVKRAEEITADEKIVDIGPEALRDLSGPINEANIVLWNGPTGLYERGFVHWTHAIASCISRSHAESIIGGADTLAVLKTSGVSEDAFSFLSTGGGAMLEFLLKGKLPALDALK